MGSFGKLLHFPFLGSSSFVLALGKQPWGSRPRSDSGNWMATDSIVTRARKLLGYKSFRINVN
jgi:hypothetical protein